SRPPPPSTCRCRSQPPRQRPNRRGGAGRSLSRPSASADRRAGAPTRNGRAALQHGVMWLDLANRKTTAPPEELKGAWHALERTPDFTWYEEKPPEPSDGGARR